MICLSGPAPYEKIFRYFFAANHRRNRRHPVPIEGASAVVTDVGAGRGGRVSVARRATLMRTAKSCGPDAPKVGVKLAMMLTHHADDGGKKARFTRESTI